MKIEAILLGEILDKYKEGIATCFINSGYKPSKKQLNLVYDFIRFTEASLLNSPKMSFEFIFNDKALLNRYGLLSFDTMHESYGYLGKNIYFKIKLLEVEAYVLKYKLDYMHIGTNF